jgi:hypothetical protein
VSIFCPVGSANRTCSLSHISNAVGRDVNMHLFTMDFALFSFLPPSEGPEVFINGIESKQ